ncbi:hypothetical protein [Umezawaea sp. Da 62-37]|uniref:hypothetical protein n=1 Tax=Umezawaea sp. Da 62-37 TaxID=3075927 RepID=UPI0028F6C36B|nr:hypothetical protein [Umezawaea sp. Da 62-37]WNV87928.1 hypothetical protein RM788_06480 [Umezawaea sp. Da 62-37]
MTRGGFEGAEELTNLGGAFDWVHPDVPFARLAGLRDVEVPPRLFRLDATSPGQAVVFSLFGHWVRTRMARGLVLEVADSWEQVEDALVWFHANPGHRADHRGVRRVLRELDHLYGEDFLPDLAALVSEIARGREGVERKLFTARTAREAAERGTTLREAAAGIADEHEQVTRAVGELRQTLLAFDPPGGLEHRGELLSDLEACYTRLTTARAELRRLGAHEDTGDEGGAFGRYAQDVQAAARDYHVIRGEVATAVHRLLVRFDEWLDKATEHYVREHYETLYPEVSGVFLAIRSGAVLLGVAGATLTLSGVGAVPGVATGVLAGLLTAVGLVGAKIERWNTVRGAKRDPALRLDAMTKGAEEVPGERRLLLAERTAKVGEASNLADEVVERSAHALEHGGRLAEHSGRVAGVVAGVASTIGHVVAPVAVVVGGGANILDWRMYARKQGVRLEEVVASETARTAEALMALAARSRRLARMGIDLDQVEVIDVVGREGFAVRARTTASGDPVELFIDQDGRFRRLDVLSLLKERVKRRPRLTVGDDEFDLEWDSAIWTEASEDDDHEAVAEVRAIRRSDHALVSTLLAVHSDAGVDALWVGEPAFATAWELAQEAWEWVTTEYVEGIRPFGERDYHPIAWSEEAWTCDEQGGGVTGLQPDASPERVGQLFSLVVAVPFTTDPLEPDHPDAHTAFVVARIWKDVVSGAAQVDVLTTVVDPPVG